MSIKLRWINYAGYEIVLPNGKVIVIDPCINYKETEQFTVEDYTGADYILLSHTHYDHTKDLGYLAHKFQGKVIVNQAAAYAVAEYFDLDLDQLYPVLPQEIYDFKDFRLHIFRSKHTFFNKKDSSNTIKYMKQQGQLSPEFPKEHLNCDIYGGIVYLDYLITTRENYRIFIAGGSPHKFTYTNIYDTMKEMSPNLVFRQTSSKYTPSEFGELIAQFGAELAFPLHQDGITRKMDISIQEYITQANIRLKELKPSAQIVNPERFKWYQIQTTVQKL